jgi:hypothetical protein
MSKLRGTRPTNITEDDVVHYATNTTTGGIVCEPHRPFGCLWRSPIEGDVNTFIAGEGDLDTNFRFTLIASLATCKKCLTHIHGVPQ